MNMKKDTSKYKQKFSDHIIFCISYWNLPPTAMRHYGDVLSLDVLIVKESIDLHHVQLRYLLPDS